MSTCTTIRLGHVRQCDLDGGAVNVFFFRGGVVVASSYLHGRLPQKREKEGDGRLQESGRLITRDITVCSCKQSHLHVHVAIGNAHTLPQNCDLYLFPLQLHL